MNIFREAQRKRLLARLLPSSIQQQNAEHLESKQAVAGAGCGKKMLAT